MDSVGVVSEILGPSVPPGFLALVHGPPSFGKSSMVLSMLESGTWGSCLLAAVEEGLGLSIRDRLVRAEAMHTSVTDASSYPELLGVLDGGDYDALCIDSVTAMDIGASQLLDLRRRYSGMALLAVAQNTKSGRHRGSLGMAHDADVVIELHEPMAWRLTKSWFSALSEGKVK
jgi:predicted ATP-dependent serine protease